MQNIFRNISLGKGGVESNNKKERWKRVLFIAFGQSKMFKKPLVACLHLIVYIGFIIINIEIIEIIIDGLFGTHNCLMRYDSLEQAMFGLGSNGGLISPFKYVYSIRESASFPYTWRYHMVAYFQGTWSILDFDDSITVGSYTLVSQSTDTNPTSPSIPPITGWTNSYNVVYDIWGDCNE